MFKKKSRLPRLVLSCARFTRPRTRRRLPHTLPPRAADFSAPPPLFPQFDTIPPKSPQFPSVLGLRLRFLPQIAPKLPSPGRSRGFPPFFEANCHSENHPNNCEYYSELCGALFV